MTNDVLRRLGETVWYGLHEVHYEGGRPVSYSEQPIFFTSDECEGPAGIQSSLSMAHADALNRPVLDEADFHSPAENMPSR